MENRKDIENSISNESIQYETIKFFEEKAKGFSEQDFLDALEEIPDAHNREIDNQLLHNSRGKRC